MNENGFDFEDNDFGDLCGLADIFPDIEPYLEDVTNSYEIAKADIDKKKIEGHVDGSDSDSGISADSYANGVLKNIDSSIHHGIFTPDKFPKPIKVTTSLIPDNKFIPNSLNENNKILIRRPISFINKTIHEAKQPIYNIIPKISNCSYERPKPIFLKSHTVCTTISEDNKKFSSKNISKITPIKLLKSNEGLPVMMSDFDIKKRDKLNFYDTSNPAVKQLKCIPSNETNNVKIEKDSCYDLFSSVNSKKDNIFLQEDLMNIHDDISLISDCQESDMYENKGDSCVNSSVDTLKSQDCQSYFEMFNSSQGLGNKVLQASSIFNNLNSCDGILDAHHYDRMVKKQERMIKNRQAASLSRQRKKEYVERLEHKVEQQKQETHYVQSQINDIRERFCALEQENQLLKRDIQTWRERYYDLERQKIKQEIISTNKQYGIKNYEVTSKSRALKATAASTTILGIFIILTFNFSSLNFNMSSLYKSANDKDIPIYKDNYPVQNAFLGNRILGGDSRLSRTLFSIIENSSVANGENLGNNICNNTSGLNTTETLRLTRELNRWGSRFKAESVKVYDRLQNERIKSQILSKEVESMFKKSKLRDVPVTINKMKKKRDFESSQLEVYPRNNDYGFFDSFINDIDRKPDTLYFVTFHSDNLIFPASNMNKNLSTPKITLFLPADINQEDKNYYKMMKIDCQVQNFTIVNLRKIKLP